MTLIDKNGERPVCECCHKPAKDYGVKVRPGRVYVCKACLATKSVTAPVQPLMAG